MLFCTCILIRVFCHSRIAIWDINKSCTYRILSISAIKKRDTRENLVSFFMPCDRRVPGAAAPTAASGRRRKVMQARNREFRRLNAEREGGRPDFEVGKAGSNPVSAIKKRDTRGNLVSFFYALRLKKRCFTPIGRRCAKIKLGENMGFARL